MDLNKAMIIGNLTRDPEIRTTNSGQNVASFGIATNRTWKDASGQKQEKAEFHNIVAWGKLADICGQYLNKGKKVYIEGRLQTRDWEAQDGTKRQRTEIVADNMIMLSRSGNEFGGATATNDARPAAAAQPAVATDDAEEVRVEDIPF